MNYIIKVEYMSIEGIKSHIEEKELNIIFKSSLLAKQAINKIKEQYLYYKDRIAIKTQSEEKNKFNKSLMLKTDKEETKEIEAFWLDEPFKIFISAKAIEI